MTVFLTSPVLSLKLKQEKKRFFIKLSWGVYIFFLKLKQSDILKLSSEKFGKWTILNIEVLTSKRLPLLDGFVPIG